MKTKLMYVGLILLLVIGTVTRFFDSTNMKLANGIIGAMFVVATIILSKTSDMNKKYLNGLFLFYLISQAIIFWIVRS